MIQKPPSIVTSNSESHISYFYNVRNFILILTTILIGIFIQQCSNKDEVNKQNVEDVITVRDVKVKFHYDANDGKFYYKKGDSSVFITKYPVAIGAENVEPQVWKTGTDTFVITLTFSFELWGYITPMNATYLYMPRKDKLLLIFEDEMKSYVDTVYDEILDYQVSDVKCVDGFYLTYNLSHQYSDSLFKFIHGLRTPPD